ncbi:MAG TPA: Txe/YoeB family addiction module toxin [Acholeplasmataceae bacterium]|nr:Txe/YoeB family addiction module toxin [Acholeplasmataceae bacterium]
MNKIFTDEAWKDYLYWFDTDKKLLKKINILIKEIDTTPYEGIGKPEKLKLNLQGFWSRRIDHEHRIIYKIENESIIFIAFRYHYSK